ncbi:uncharacterized protein LOC131045822 [Cryptomeria japonica]|uniref:uncharacterized protein LOC131045822 n=1 Tax=Cryptomeria japonica TaxID=3369 RepID=UPI0027DA5E6B|nr:uncharacterized protein LOC131045822 [Cryptomeria japonica]
MNVDKDNSEVKVNIFDNEKISKELAQPVDSQEAEIPTQTKQPSKTEKPTEGKGTCTGPLETEISVEMQTQTYPPEENASKMDTPDGSKDIIKIIGQTSGTSTGEFRRTNITEKLGHWAKSCPLKKSKESKTDSNVKYKMIWQMIDKKGDSSAECDQNKEVMELVNEVKKGENSNNEKQDCVCSNNQTESTKEGEKGRELNNKNNPEDPEVGSVSQEKKEVIPNEVVPISSFSKSIEENFNEAQVFNPSDIEPLLILTNGSPKPPQCKTSSHSVVMDILEGNLQILGSKEGKLNKEELNGGGNGYGSSQNNGHNRGNNGNYGNGSGGDRNNNNGNGGNNENNGNNNGGGNSGNIGNYGNNGGFNRGSMNNQGNHHVFAKSGEKSYYLQDTDGEVLEFPIHAQYLKHFFS